MELLRKPRSLSGSALSERIDSWIPDGIQVKGTRSVHMYKGQCCSCSAGPYFSVHYKPSLEKWPMCEKCRALPIQVSESTSMIPGYHPDVLVLHDLEINGQLVRWIDCKAYYGSGLLTNNKRKYRMLPVNKIQAQVDRYTDKYGPGAILFLRGFHSQMKLSGALLLDASPLDLSAIDAYLETA